MSLTTLSGKTKYMWTQSSNLALFGDFRNNFHLFGCNCDILEQKIGSMPCPPKLIKSKYLNFIHFTLKYLKIQIKAIAYS